MWNIYADGKKDVAVIDSILKEYPIGIIYFNKVSDDSFEIFLDLLEVIIVDYLEIYLVIKKDIF